MVSILELSAPYFIFIAMHIDFMPLLYCELIKAGWFCGHSKIVKFSASRCRSIIQRYLASFISIIFTEKVVKCRMREGMGHK